MLMSRAQCSRDCGRSPEVPLQREICLLGTSPANIPQSPVRPCGEVSCLPRIAHRDCRPGHHSNKTSISQEPSGQDVSTCSRAHTSTKYAVWFICRSWELGHLSFFTHFAGHQQVQQRQPAPPQPISAMGPQILAIKPRAPFFVFGPNRIGLLWGGSEGRKFRL